MWALVACLALAACAEAGPAGDAPATVPVFAASSLTGAFGRVQRAFEADRPGIDVVVSSAGSSTLAAQIVQGAPAAVFASADRAQMRVVADAGLVAGRGRAFARNVLAIAVRPANPLGIRDLGDLADPDVAVVLAAPHVPVGRYAREALRAAGADVRPASLELDASAVVSKVALGEADAGVVYVSDVEAAGADVAGVAVPRARNVVATYPIAVLRGAADPAAARAFTAFVLSPRGQRILAAHGFLPR
ncbi:molybdate ABC transporter substrate-binding protein [soil metagenome]